MNKKLSVIVGVYNPPLDLLSRCIESIINQTYKNLEIILLDDGSTNGAEIACDDFAQNDDRVRVVHQKNYGAHAKFEIGYDLVTGDYATIVDNDDFLELDCYEHLMCVANERDVDVVDAGFIHHDFRTGTITPRYVGTAFEYDNMKDILLNLQNTWWVDAWCRIVKKECLKHNEDFELLDRIEFIDAKCFVHIPYAGYHWCERQGSTSTSRLNDWNFDILKKKQCTSNINLTLEKYPFLKEELLKSRLNSLIGAYDKAVNTTRPRTNHEEEILEQFRNYLKVDREFMSQLKVIDKVKYFAVTHGLLYWPAILNHKLNIIKR
ncbi:glycosyltransferase family 2 protein [Lactococcus raffinolactis]|jgi:glycosyltransferase involved in cell wall biosynthesis|uniref:glycosyltransferase family 2 protein n=1 Tax=Pseudolactococcus raffinolactis TaxID=1366 RepID=UPI0034CEDEBA